jgi:HD-GYP domain-containing protein (c-di-GMP phosphodiesterase class II)
MSVLEHALGGEFDKFGIKPQDRDSIRNHLSLLKSKDEPTYEHSIRVGVLSARIGEYMHLDPKALLFAGALHDMGKLLQDPDLLKKSEGFSEEDMEEMRRHPLDTFKILNGKHNFSAIISLMHHYWQEHCYPEELPDLPEPFSQKTRATLEFYAKIVAIADFYDAASTRENEKFGERRKLGCEEVKDLLLGAHGDLEGTIIGLYDEGILGRV